jgi:proline dehydrogenase
MNSVTVQIELSTAQAQALAQFAKRLGWTTIRGLAVDDEEASAMREAIDHLSTELAQIGFDPR